MMRVKTLVGLLLLALGVQQARAETVVKTVPGFEVTVTATQTGPAAGGDPYHTLGSESMNITFSGTVLGKVKGLGTYEADTYWHFIGMTCLNTIDHIADAWGTTGIPPTPLYLPSCTTTEVTTTLRTVSGVLNTPAGGHTAFTELVGWSQSFDHVDLPAYARHSVNFSVINP